jgi:hypothetical protein
LTEPNTQFAAGKEAEGKSLPSRPSDGWRMQDPPPPWATPDFPAWSSRIETASLMIEAMLGDAPSDALTFAQIENACRAAAHWLAAGRTVSHV